MAGRNPPQHVGNLRQDHSNRTIREALLIEESRVRLLSSSSSSCSHLQHQHQRPGLVEDRIALYQREIQSLLLENQRLAATHVALKQELSFTQKDVRHLAAAAQQVKAERDAEVRAVLEKSVKVEAEYRALEPLTLDLLQVREDLKNLRDAKEKLEGRLRAAEGDLERTRSDLEDLPEIRSQMETLSQDIQKGRAALETERKTTISNNEQGLVMERNMLTLERQINKLQTELANAEKKKAAAAAAANPGQGYLVPTYADSGSGYGEGDTLPAAGYSQSRQLLQ